ncbi:MAG: hypothetical protein GC155_03970 [Alphaproteobacteria bacterium]|nr:hypothetical protein [Alphaproteobacteria bacterium]
MIQAARLAFDPLIPWVLLWSLVGGAAVLWIVYVALRGRAWLLRALALSILTLALANPLWVKEQREPLKDIVAVVLDRSESMQFKGRTEAAKAAFDQIKQKIEADDTMELRVAETDPEADGTDMYAALQAALSDAPRERIGGAIMITDGQIHDLPADPKEAAQLGPIHGLIVGGENEVDRRIEIQSAPSFGIVDQPVEMRIEVDDPKEKTVDVSISINGVPQRPQRVNVGEPSTIKLTMKRRGDNLVVLQVPGIPGELTLANNLASANISGVKDRLRVLLVTGEPHAGARVWRDLLKSDPQVDLVHFTILRPPQKTDTTPTDEIALISFPKAELFKDKLDQFDLVIFDHELRPLVLEPQYLDRISRYVENGGALLVAVGPPYKDPDAVPLYNSPLAAVLPGIWTGQVVEKKFVPQLTALGKRHSVTATLPTDPPWGPWMRYMKVEKGGDASLMQAPDGSPLLLLKRVSKGRVATVLSDQIWLWARGYEGGGPYAELIRRVAHWLMKEPELEEEFLKLKAGSQSIEADLRTLSDNPPPLDLTGPDGKSTETPWTLVSPGQYRADLPAGELGLYSAKSGDLTAVALRGPSHPREYQDLRATTDILKPLATATLGGVMRIGSDSTPNMPDIRRVAERGNAAGSNWIGIRKRNAYAVRATESINLLPGVLGMALAVLFMMLAWRREGR